MKQVFMVLLALAMVSVAGCRERKLEISDIRTRAWKAIDAGQADKAVRIVEKAMANEAMRPYRSDLLLDLVSALLAGDKLDAAKKRFLDVLGKEPGLAVTALPAIPQYLVWKGKPEDAVRWCESLASRQLPDDVMLALGRIHIAALAAADKLGQAVALAQSYASKLQPASTRDFVELVAQWLERSGKLDTLAALNAWIDANHGNDPDWLATRTRGRVLLSSALGKWTDAAKEVCDNIGGIGDAPLADIYQYLVAKCAATNQFAVADELSLVVLKNATDKATARSAAGRWSVRIPTQRGDVKTAIERVAGLAKQGFDTGFQLRVIDPAYSLAVSKGTDDDLRSLVSLCETMMGATASDEEKGVLRGMMLDVCAKLDDFDRVATLVEAGIPGQKPEARDMMLNKVKAHQALKAGRKQEAVERFRNFLEYLNAKGGDQFDPVTRTKVFKEQLIGLNAKRIGDILASMGETEQAAASYETARNAYKTALQKAGPGSPQYREIEEAVKGIPSSN